MVKCDFSGWATRNDLLCGDGRVIKKDAFKHNDGKTVSLVWNHNHDDPEAVLGHALLENRDEGVYAYCTFNDTDSGKNAKLLVQHGDVSALSICANKLKHQGNNVIHGEIRELSLVLAGANPGAYIEYVDSEIAHSDDGEEVVDCLYAGWNENIIIHSFEDENEQNLEHSETKQEETKVAEDAKKTDGNEQKEKTVQEVFDEMSEEQQNVVYAMVGMALEEAGADEDDDNSEGGNETMKHNVFDQEDVKRGNVLTHADQMAIMDLAKSSSVGTLKKAMEIYMNENDMLEHGAFEDKDLVTLFPEFKDVHPGAPELITRDQGWVGHVMSGVKKSPYTRIRTRQADARIAALRAKGYEKGKEKTNATTIRLLSRTTEPQTIYIKDELNRDDILDIQDFDLVNYQRRIMRMTLDEEIACAIMFGDGREDGDPDKIHEDRIRPIWTDEDLYVIKQDFDLAKFKAELQGTNTSANFGENYIYSEGIVQTYLYAREKYKGKGTPDFYCDPHLVNVMLLARDLNGRRIYNNKADLAAALNVGKIHEVEQMAGKTRTDKDGKTKKLLGIFVNLDNYQLGAVKGGEITNFNQFDIDFNKEKFLMECRLSGALTEIYSAIVLEELVAEEAAG